MSGSTSTPPGQQETAEFLGALAHELRDPLGSIDVWARALSSGAADPETTRRGLLAIVNGVRAQAHLIDHLSDVARVLRGEIDTASPAAALVPILRRAVDLAAAEAHGREIQLVVAAPDEGFAVAGDPDALQRLLATLLRLTLRSVPERSEIVLHVRRAERVEIAIRAPGPALPRLQALLAPLLSAQRARLEAVEVGDAAGARMVLSLAPSDGT